MTRYFNNIDDPLTVGWVPTTSIKYVSGRSSSTVPLSSAGTVQGGDWDLNNKKFIKENKWYKIMYERYTHNKPWIQFDEIKKHMKEVKRGKEWRGCNSTKEVIELCKYWDKLYENVKNDGYHSQLDVIKFENNSNVKSYIKNVFRCYDEITVDIGRQGELLFVNGRHRLSIAKILDVDQVPVRVDVRHKKFVQNGGKVTFQKKESPLLDLTKFYIKDV